MYQLLWGYYFQFFILVALYPAISFFAFFGVPFRLFSYIMFHIFLTFWWSRTPIFHFSLFSGCISVFLIHYVSYFPCFLVVVYPDISFFAFFGVHFRLSHTLCFIFSLFFSGRVPRYFIFAFFGVHFRLSHTLCFIFSLFLVVAYPNISFFGVRASSTSLIVASAHSYSPKRTPTFYF